MKKIIPFILFTLFLPTILKSQIINSTDAEIAARNFITQYANLNKNKLAKTLSINIATNKSIQSNNGKEIAYVFETIPEGFIVTSRNRSISPIIAYSFSGKFNYEGNDENLLLYLIKSNLDYLENNSSHVDQKIINKNQKKWDILLSASHSTIDLQQWPSLGSTSTGGWITTTWDQNNPFNKMLPFDPIAPSLRSLTGCIATAMAQLLNYHKQIGNYNLSSIDRYTALWRGINIDSDSSKLSFASFNVVNNFLKTIRTKYSSNANLNEDEIAALNFYCGILTTMDYGFCGSYSYTKNIFSSFTQKLKNYNANHYSFFDDNVLRSIKSNIQNGLPVILGINRDDLSNHVVLADGYNESNFYHLNFGWGSSQPNTISDAWYFIPDKMGANYNKIDDVILNIFPSSQGLPSLTLNSEIINLGFTKINTPSNSKILKIFNSSNFPITINNIKTKAPFSFSIGNNPKSVNINNITIAAQSNIELQVFCDPKEIGVFNQEINICYSNTKYINCTVSCSGLSQNCTMLSEGELSGELKKENSPYYISGNIKIKSSLTIQPGVQLFFLDRYGIEVLNSGTLICSGSASDSIKFSAFNPATGWCGISLKSTVADDVFNYCSFSYSRKDTANSKNYYDEFSSGGALYILNSSPTISNSTFEHCKGFAGGAISISFPEANSSIHNRININACTFKNNEGDFRASSIFLKGSCDIWITDSKFYDNISSQDGTVFIDNPFSESVISKSSFFNNHSNFRNGAITISNSVFMLMNNVLIYSNYPVNGGSIVWFNRIENVLVQNCTIANNILYDPRTCFNSVYSTFCSKQTFINSIFYNPQSTFEIKSENHLIPPQIKYCLLSASNKIYSEFTNENNLYGNPLFNVDYSLAPNSPCINRGLNIPIYEDNDGTVNNLGHLGGSSFFSKSLVMNFGNVPLSSSKNLSIDFYNLRDTSFPITSIKSSDNNFTSNSNYPLEIIAKSKYSAVFSFSPNKVGIANSKIDFYSTGLSANFFSINLDGKGISETILSGSVNGILTKDKSPYFITSNINIPVNDSLTIEAGTLLKFEPEANFTVSGKLKILGNEKESVLFTSTDTSKCFNKIIFKNSIGHKFNYWNLIYSKGILFERTLNKREVLIFNHCVFNKNSNLTAEILAFDVYDIEMNSCLFSDNSGYALIGHVFSNFAKYTNCLFSNNKFSFQNIMAGHKYVLFQNCTFYSNSSAHNGIITTENSYLISESINFINSIAYKNSLPFIQVSGKNYQSGNPKTPIVTYSNLELGINSIKITNGFPDMIHYENNISSDPLFLDTNYHLSDGSPCIDRGNPDPKFIDIIDNTTSKAKWPAMGTMLNDMGIYGGHANYSYKPIIQKLASFSFYNSQTIKLDLDSCAVVTGEINPKLTWSVTCSSNKLLVNKLFENNTLEISCLDKQWYGNSILTFLVKDLYGGKDSLSVIVTVKNTTAVKEINKELPNHFELSQNYPNPFNPTTKIKFGLPKNAFTNLVIYDVLGREVKSLINSELSAGFHTINFDASSLASGIYFYRITANDFTSIKKMLLIK